MLLNILIQTEFMFKYLILNKNLFRFRNIECERNRAFVIIGYFGQEKQVQSI